MLMMHPPHVDHHDVYISCSCQGPTGDSLSIFPSWDIFVKSKGKNMTDTFKTGLRRGTDAL